MSLESKTNVILKNKPKNTLQHRGSTAGILRKAAVTSIKFAVPERENLLSGQVPIPVDSTTS